MFDLETRPSVLAKDQIVIERFRRIEEKKEKNNMDRGGSVQRWKENTISYRVTARKLNEKRKMRSQKGGRKKKGAGVLKERKKSRRSPGGKGSSVSED